MLHRINRYKLANHVCCVVKYKADTRYDDTKVATHDLHLHDAMSTFLIGDIWDELLKAHVIGIDEGQFFDDIVEYAEKLANLGKIVIIAALDGDFNRKRFKNNSLDLCAMAEYITKLTAVCTHCGEDAAFTFRKSSSLKQEVIGGQEIYSAFCRNCYLLASKDSNFTKSDRICCGRIELILGPMFSGKTTELLRRRNRHALAGRDCKVVRYDDGSQFHPNQVVTHDELVYDAITTTKISDIYEALVNCAVVLIDDGQFGNVLTVCVQFPDIVEASERLANSGKIVIVSALDGDYHRKPFENGVLNLCPLSEVVTKLCAVCSSCDKDAAFSRKFTDSNMSNQQHEKKMYCAVCRSCYLRAIKVPLSDIQNSCIDGSENNIERKRVSLGDGMLNNAKKLRDDIN
uniref:Thymidine kinase, cytosolic n=1 Tax=Syphacia muris TaxID=451379 RepID=A0A0N5AJ38_9BILA